MQTVKMWTVLGLLLLAVHVKDSRAQNTTSQMTSAQTVTNGSSATPAAPVTMTMQMMNLTFSVSDVTNATTRGTTMSTSMNTSQQVMVSSGATPSNTASPGFADVTNITNDVTSSKAYTTTALISVNVTTTRMGDRTTNSSTSEKPSSMVAMTAGSSTVAMTPGNSTVAMIPGSSTASMVSTTIVIPGSSPVTPTSQPLSTPTTPMGQQSSSPKMSSSQPTAASRTPEVQSSAAVSEASTPSREVSSSPNVSIAAPKPTPGGLSMGAMIGIGVGCACALLVLIVVPIVLWRRKRQQEEMSSHVASQSDLWMDDVTYGRPSTGLGPSVRLSRIEIDGNTYSFTPVGPETKEAGSAGANESEKSTFRPSLAAFSTTNETSRPSVIEEDVTE
ncbi:Hypp8572 [Branchiostoma lanceolatum]|uniref:Hypp8572 protein n=1 Tax=Branchiostoma lanceolatum TaxID=7740 RepID=A0A8J9Z9K5_BRALA|nr:Hypp8572 [Branchiostoma lanceolatum]